MKSLKGKRKAAARKVPLEKRRQFVELLWRKMTVSAAANACGLTVDEAMGIISLNTLPVPRLRKPENVV